MKTFLLVISEMLGLFGNMLIAEHMYSRNRWEKFQQQVETLVCQKRKRFSENVIAFFELTQNSEHFGQKNELRSLNISEFIDPEKCSYFNALKVLF